jgi:hypothetical protein
MPMDRGLAREYAAREMQSEDVAVTEAEWVAASDPRPIRSFSSFQSADSPADGSRTQLTTACGEDGTGEGVDPRPRAFTRPMRYRRRRQA